MLSVKYNILLSKSRHTQTHINLLLLLIYKNILINPPSNDHREKSNL